MNKPISLVERCDNMEFMSKFPDKFFDLAVPDPWYGIGATEMQMGHFPNRKGKLSYPSESTAVKLKKGRLNSGGGSMKNSCLVNTHFEDKAPSPDFFKELFRVSKHQIIWGGNYFDLPPTRGIICWDKLQPWDNFSQWEMAWTSFDCPAKIFRFSNTGGRNHEVKIHPTQKPVQLYSWLFKTFAKHGFKILDTNLGSQSSRIAAFSQRLDFYGCEIDNKIFSDGCERFEKKCHGIIKVEDKTIVQQSLFQ